MVRAMLLRTLCAALSLAAVVVSGAPLGQSSHALSKLTLPRTGKSVVASSPGEAIYPMGGNVWPVAVYYMYIDVGTPAKPYCVAIDTGSTTAAVSDARCTTCSQDPENYSYYNASLSSTSQLVQAGGYGGSYQTCNFADPGAECDDSGDLFADTVAIGPATIKNYQIGSMTYVSSNFDQFKVSGTYGDERNAKRRSGRGRGKRAPQSDREWFTAHIARFLPSDVCVRRCAEVGLQQHTARWLVLRWSRAHVSLAD